MCKDVIMEIEEIISMFYKVIFEYELVIKYEIVLLSWERCLYMDE